MRTLRCSLALVLALVAWPVAGAPIHWKAVLVSGHATDGEGHALANWDRSRDAFHALLLARGLAPDDIRILTSEPSLVGTSSRGTPLGRGSTQALDTAVESLGLGPGDGLILWMTSHGSRGSGWVWERDGEGGSWGVVTPAHLADLLARTVGDGPAVVLISSCFSGQFLGDEGVTGRQRVVLTAARADRSSFGCGAGSRMPEWDESLVRLWTAMPTGFLWPTLVAALADDVAGKEGALAEARRSFPQASVGPGVDFDGL